eukprot:8778059-Pyramimonas_sp.AAC.1
MLSFKQMNFEGFVRISDGKKGQTVSWIGRPCVQSMYCIHTHARKRTHTRTRTLTDSAVSVHRTGQNNMALNVAYLPTEAPLLLGFPSKGAHTKRATGVIVWTLRAIVWTLRAIVDQPGCHARCQATVLEDYNLQLILCQALTKPPSQKHQSEATLAEAPTRSHPRRSTNQKPPSQKHQSEATIAEAPISRPVQQAALRRICSPPWLGARPAGVTKV